MQKNVLLTRTWTFDLCIMPGHLYDAFTTTSAGCPKTSTNGPRLAASGTGQRRPSSEYLFLARFSTSEPTRTQVRVVQLSVTQALPHRLVSYRTKFLFLPFGHELLEEPQFVMKRGREEDDRLPLQIGYVYDDNLLKEACKLPNIRDRALVVHKLIESYDLLRNTVILKPDVASEEDLCAFHSSDYIKYLQEINNRYTPEDEVNLEYGLGYDCPPLDGVYDYCQVIGGSTLAAAKSLNKGEVDVAINWFGGWHHAQRDEAEGFCYVNDVVLGISELRKSFNYVVYLDLDVHHGNGVEASFEFTPKVLTVSFHQFESGFYPGSGALSEVGTGPGQYYSVNVPLLEGIGDRRYCRLFDSVWNEILDCFEFDAIVVQCGADGLSGDTLGGFNLTEEAYGHCLRKVLEEAKPTLVLGGGGYNIANTARCWAFLTSVIVGVEVDSDIPEHDHFSLYGPSYELKITPSHRKDTNSDEYINKVLKEVKENLSKLLSYD